MLRLAQRRAGHQVPLLAAVLAVVVIGTTLLGVCVLLLTTTRDRADDEAAARAPAAAVDVTAFVGDVAGRNVAAVAGDTRGELSAGLAPFAVSTSARASSVLRHLGPARPSSQSQTVGYLGGVDGLAGRVRLLSGRLPRGASECVVLPGTARELGVTVGSRVRLGAELAPGQAGSMTLVVVGLVRPAPGAGWDRDLLAGRGYDPAFNDGRFPVPAHAYGPFVVDLPTLLGGGSALDRLQVTAHPDLSTATGARLAQVSAALPGADRRLSRRLGDRVGVERIATGLPATLSAERSQSAATSSVVLVVALLGAALTATALGLAGGLVAGLRRDETALLSALGASRCQFAGAAAVEAAALAIPAALLAVPLSSLVHSALTHRPFMARAGLATGPVVTASQVAVVVAGALGFGAVLLVAALRPISLERAGRGRAGLLARSGADAGLVALAIAAWWQLRSQPVFATRADAVRVLAPAVVLLAGAAVVQRLVVLLLRGAERLVRRSRGLVLPLAVLEAARRPQAVAAALLISLAAAAGTFGLAFGATWERSQSDQADARAGTDLSLTLVDPAVAGQGAAVAAATGGRVSPVTDQGVAVGQWLGGGGPAPRLIAVDTTRAGELLRGRLPGGLTWAAVGAGLTPPGPVGGVDLVPGPSLTLTGTSGGPGLRVTPRLVVQDPAGLRTAVDAGPVPLDGRAHRLRLSPSLQADQRLVAVDFVVSPDPDSTSSSSAAVARVDLALGLPATAAVSASASARWSATPSGRNPDSVRGATASVSLGEGSAVVRATASVGLQNLGEAPAEVVATAFTPLPAVPVVVSRPLADTLLVRPGARLTVTVGATRVPVLVKGVVPSVPSAPAAGAVLADVDALSRALIVVGDLTPVADAWWVAHPARPDAAARVGALALGDVVTRAGVRRELAGAPPRVGLPAALDLLVPAAAVLLLAGVLLHVVSDVRARALEVARLRGLGVSRRNRLQGLLIQHGGVLTLLIGAGAVAGAVAARAVAPLLVRSDLGGAPVPAAVAHWPWAAEATLLALLVGGGFAAVALVVAVQVRRADAAHLRVGG